MLPVIRGAAASLFPAFLVSVAPLTGQVSEKHFERPPYYSGKVPSRITSVGHFPIRYQSGGSHDALFDPTNEVGGVADRLVRDMNAYLEDFGFTVALTEVPRAAGRPPDVSFGCDLSPIDECEERDDGEALGRQGTASGWPPSIRR